jgi:hypothetical protein
MSQAGKSISRRRFGVRAALAGGLLPAAASAQGRGGPALSRDRKGA